MSLVWCLQDAWAHRATDPSVLRRRGRNSSSFSTLIALAFLVLLAAIALHFAQEAGLLKDLPYDVDGMVQQARATVQPIVQPYLEQAQKLLIQ